MTTTRLIHADDHLALTSDVAPAIHPSTTFEYSHDVDKLIPARDRSGEGSETDYVYSRLHSPTVTRAEAVLTELFNAHAICYGSGLAAIHALLVHLAPKRICIGRAYHGTHGICEILSRNYGTKILNLQDIDQLQLNDVCWVESPVNPYGTCVDLVSFAEKAHAQGAILCLDATFGPPHLQDPFKLNVDYVVHSMTKYLGGHSDLLAGVVLTKSKQHWEGLFADRLLLGSIMSTLESYLLLRSLRTLNLRVPLQSSNAAKLVNHIAKDKRIVKIWHNTLQKESFVAEQCGPCPVFSFTLASEQA